MTIKLTTNIFFLKHLTSKISKVFQIYCKENCTSQGQGRKAAQQTSSCKIAPPFWGEAALLSGIFEGSNLKISPILSNTAVLKAKREDPESSTESSPPCTSTSLSCPQVQVQSTQGLLLLLPGKYLRTPPCIGKYLPQMDSLRQTHYCHT